MQQETMGEAPPTWQITRREASRWEATQQRDDGTTATITLFCGDCLQGMAGLQPGSVDVVVTSPPTTWAFATRGMMTPFRGRSIWNGSAAGQRP